jgi:hypothetical protein
MGGFREVPAMVRAFWGMGMCRQTSMRAVRPAHAVLTVEAQSLGRASHPRSWRQSDPPGAAASKCRVDVNQTGGFSAYDAVVAVSDITPLAPITPMGNVTAAGHVVRVRGGAPKTASVAAVPYEMAAAEMAAAEAATPEVAATASAMAPTAAAAMAGAAAAATAAMASAAAARGSARGDTGRAGARNGRSDESRNAEDGSERDEAVTHRSVSRKDDCASYTLVC